jgi:hypothetical protein
MQVEHPAMRAWRQLRPLNAAPEQIEEFEEDSLSTTVYRLVCAGEARSNVIAKRSRQRTARIERTLYEEILPNLPFPILHYYGSVEEPDGEFWWLFLEDVSSDKEYLPQNKEHRVAAAQWLGIMNTFASGIAAVAHLPERTPQHYLNLLHSARQTIQSNLSNPALKAGDLALLENILDHCEHLSAHWNELMPACEGIPRTLVHGDFIKKNVRVRYTPDGIVILPFDWEKAGWGIPAEDISRVHLPTYWSTIHEHWPRLTVQTLNRLTRVGKVFRCLVFLDWIAPRLAFASLEQPVNDIRRCESWLAGLIRAPEWRN